MKIRLVKWTVDGSVLKVARIIGESAVIEAEFDLVKFFPNFPTMSEAQQLFIIFGTKQKLMDKGASEIGNAGGKIANAKKVWEDLLAGKWSGERLNSTGASDNKKIATEMKAMAEVVSFQGLAVKRALASMGKGTFTEEDEVKFQDFLRMEIK